MVLYLLDPVREVLFAEMQLGPRRRLFIYEHGPYKTVHTGGAFDVGSMDESLTVYFEQSRLTVLPSANFLRDVHATAELVRGGGLDPVVERPVIQGPWLLPGSGRRLPEMRQDWQPPPLHSRGRHEGRRADACDLEEAGPARLTCPNRSATQIGIEDRTEF